MTMQQRKRVVPTQSSVGGKSSYDEGLVSIGRSNYRKEELTGVGVET